MKVTVFTDYHCGSPIELCSVDKLWGLVVDAIARKERVIMLGDNIDLAGCKKSDVVHYRLWRIKFRELAKVEPLLDWNDGNHERSSLEDETVIIDDKVFKHGHFQKWPLSRVMRYLKKSHGASKFKRKFIIPLIEWAEKFGVNRVTKKLKRNALDVLEKEGCNTLVVGHVHVPKMVKVALGIGNNLIVLPRGKTVLELI